MMKYKFKENVFLTTSDFYYDLFVSGYIKAKDLLINDIDIIKLNNAIDIIKKFEKESVDEGVIRPLF